MVTVGKDEKGKPISKLTDAFSDFGAGFRSIHLFASDIHDLILSYQSDMKKA